ncbi:MAG: carboxypeptidase-like regulatory domain-containing protein [Armatimonadetes bacterium]|nr:carboxypeptidase-like regulatory domain-containing protein [Armatimonadota bacterium]
MKNEVTQRSPQLPSSLLFLCVLVMLLGLISCGSGGGGNGGSGGGGGGGTGRTITGVVRDFTVLPVPNVLVQLTGTTLHTTTNASGGFTFTNVPAGVTTITVTRPAGTGYYNIAVYKGKTYDLAACTIAIPVSAATNIGLSEITLYGGSDPNNPPPPPPPTSGCP